MAQQKNVSFNFTILANSRFKSEALRTSLRIVNLCATLTLPILPEPNGDKNRMKSLGSASLSSSGLLSVALRGAGNTDSCKNIVATIWIGSPIATDVHRQKYASKIYIYFNVPLTDSAGL